MIRFARNGDIPPIMEFIDEHWRKNHILVRDRRMFEFQHVWGNEISFVISEEENGINGVLGYIPYDTSNRDVMLAIWKTIKTADTMLGIKILNFLRDDFNIKSISAPGINPRTRVIYEFLGIQTDCMKHWYRLKATKQYKIALVADDEIPLYNFQQDVQIKEYTEFEELVSDFKLEKCLHREGFPFKGLDYLERRYFQHPVFEYLKYGIQYGDKKLLLILRIQSCNLSAALRVIDGIGDLELFPCFTAMLDELMDYYTCEYADIYETGISDEILLNGGWKFVADTENIIPEYFSPFEQKNVDIYYMSEIPNVVLFKGDGDMDRPN